MQNAIQFGLNILMLHRICEKSSYNLINCNISVPGYTNGSRVQVWVGRVQMLDSSLTGFKRECAEDLPVILCSLISVCSSFIYTRQTRSFGKMATRKLLEYNILI